MLVVLGLIIPHINGGFSLFYPINCAGYMKLLKTLILFLFACLVSGLRLYAQNAGGQSVYSFLRLPIAAQQTAVGGENTSLINAELSLAHANPSLLRPYHHSQLSVSFTPMPAGVKHLYGAAAFYHEKSATSFAAQVQYTGYGSIPQTDPAGNELGTFQPRDYQVQLTASRKYLEKWHYGTSLQFIQSNYGAYRSSAMAITVGINYYDSARQFQVGLVMKNMGTQLRGYTNAGIENLPFDLQLGITKRLNKAPLQFSLTLRDLHQLVLFKPDSSTSTADQVLQHMVLGAQAFIAGKIELAMGYNHLRRKELIIPNTANGLTGYSMGLGILLTRFQLRYARTFYSTTKGYHQVGINIKI